MSVDAFCANCAERCRERDITAHNGERSKRRHVHHASFTSFERNRSTRSQRLQVIRLYTQLIIYYMYTIADRLQGTPEEPFISHLMQNASECYAWVRAYTARNLRDTALSLADWLRCSPEDIYFLYTTCTEWYPYQWQQQKYALFLSYQIKALYLSIS